MFLSFTAPSTARSLTVTRVLQDGVELNWLPPTEPNGEVHYVVQYKREDSGSWTSVNTASDSTHYNLTGLHSGTNYTIRVVAVNSAGKKDDNAFHLLAIIITGSLAGVAFLLILTILFTVGSITCLVIRKRSLGRLRTPQEQNRTTTQRTEEATEEETYDYVDNQVSVEEGRTQYQGLNSRTHDYVNTYSQLVERKYQELDPCGREMEHQYHKANADMPRWGKRM